MSADSHPLISIITPAYNHESFIGSCIESVLAQTYPTWEQIIIDDGSTDRSREVIRHFSDSRIRLIEQSHQGIKALARTYNRALATAKGSLIAMLEGDDAWPSDKLFAMVPMFNDREIVLAFGEVQDIKQNGDLVARKSRTSRRRAHLPKSVLFNDPVRSSTSHLLSVAGQTFIPPSTVIIRRDALKAIGGFQDLPGTSTVDIPTFARLSLVGKFHYSPQLLGLRRHHLNSATAQYLEPLTESAQAFALSASADPAFGLSRAERKLVEESWTEARFGSKFSLGRICLLNDQRKEARKHFAEAMKANEALLVIASILGWGLSWLHADLEGLARLTGRATLLEDKN